MEKILLVEDDQNLSMMILENLEDLEFEVFHLLDGKGVLPLMEQETFDLILMDVDLGGGKKDGFEIAEEIRTVNRTLPIIFATAKKSVADLERGFKIGYMDYLKKPFGIRELSLRINSLLNREEEKKDSYQLGTLTFEPSIQCLSKEGIHIKLSKLESSFLKILCENEGHVINKEDTIKELWKMDEDPQGKESSLHNIAYKLRKILEEEPSVSIKTISKGGYLLYANNV
ncbi:MAG: response regulator transcription factor [Bacteroidales bacterium]|nr:response regulator transcription factor [Bacteroidales bacterium]MDD4712333.1 response regulator transcription factor [Bacteroidales bacterium]